MKIGLELHIVHSYVESTQVIIFVFPLSLVGILMMLIEASMVMTRSIGAAGEHI